MATVRASTGSTIVAILGTLNASASSIAKVIDAGADSVDMLTAYIQKAKSEQAAAHKIAAERHETNLINEAAKEQAKLERDLEKELSGDKRLSELFLQNQATYKALFTEE